MRIAAQGTGALQDDQNDYACQSSTLFCMYPVSCRMQKVFAGIGTHVLFTHALTEQVLSDSWTRRLGSDLLYDCEALAKGAQVLLQLVLDSSHLALCKLLDLQHASIVTLPPQEPGTEPGCDSLRIPGSVLPHIVLATADKETSNEARCWVASIGFITCFVRGAGCCNSLHRAQQDRAGEQGAPSPGG